MHLLTRWLDLLGRLSRPERPEDSLPFDPLAPSV
ncbi:MAG: hypothetical protein QOF59_1549 [Actinomycetota bacterium]|jgi:hypothetical protein|nr:hypothetical protein [Actinomycetota bacterium]